MMESNFKTTVAKNASYIYRCDYTNLPTYIPTYLPTSLHLPVNSSTNSCFSISSVENEVRISRVYFNSNVSITHHGMFNGGWPPFYTNRMAILKATSEQ